MNVKFGVEISDLFRKFGMKIETCFDELYLYDECTTSSSYEHLHVHTMYHKTQIIMILPNLSSVSSPQGISSDLSSSLGMAETNSSPLGNAETNSRETPTTSPFSSFNDASGNTSPYDISDHSSSSGTGPSPPAPKKNGITLDLSSDSSSSSGTGAFPSAPKKRLKFPTKDLLGEKNHVAGQFIFTKTVQHIDTLGGIPTCFAHGKKKTTFEHCIQALFSPNGTLEM